MVNLDSDDLLEALRERSSEALLWVTDTTNTPSSRARAAREMTAFSAVADWIEKTYMTELIPDD